MMDKTYAKEKIKELSGADPSRCMKCGKCSATCPVRKLR